MAEEQKIAETTGEGKVNGRRWSARSRNRAMGIFGALIIIFACVGVVATAIAAVNGVRSAMNNDEEKDHFAELIYPLVIMDPATFDDVSRLDQKTILTAGVWNFLLHADFSEYEANAMGAVTVPQVDIEYYCAQLFGTGLTYEHQPLGDTEYSFAYDEENQSYDIPTNNMYISYLPEVTEIAHEADGIVSLTVNYISPSVAWNYNVFHEKDFSYEPQKIMKYVLATAEDGSYYIIEVEAIELNAHDNNSGLSSDDGDSNTDGDGAESSDSGTDDTSEEA